MPLRCRSASHLVQPDGTRPRPVKVRCSRIAPRSQGWCRLVANLVPLSSFTICQGIPPQVPGGLRCPDEEYVRSVQSNARTVKLCQSGIVTSRHSTLNRSRGQPRSHASRMLVVVRDSSVRTYEG